jgi:N-acyl-D-amino-acid deacylase
VAERPILVLGRLFLLLVLAGCAPPQPLREPAEHYDLLIRNGIVYDGSGGPGRRADVAIRADRVVALGDLASATASSDIDAAGQAVAPVLSTYCPGPLSR